MSFAEGTLLYLFLSRLVIAGAGVVSMILGYRLFARGVQTHAGEAGSTIESSFVGARFTVKNAAPGTAFALFGAMLITVMLIQSSPSVTFETVNKYRTSTETEPVAAGPQTPSETSERLVMRGEHENTITSITKQGREMESRGDVAGAERAYREAVTALAEPINDLAWIYLGSNRRNDALGLARLAVQLRPDEPRYTDTLNKARSAPER
ncbi:MAG TPA: hypothetical protein VI455_12230 [Terriglobia bacterium]